jgi:catechol 2,3-dioxygenase-like lactoylglutathione lyase family enzyme
VATVHPDRAKRFYRDVLGLRLVSDDQHALVFEANGTMLRVAKVQELTPATHTVLGWRVTGIEAAVQELLGKGVTFQRYPWLAQDQVGIWTAVDGTKVAWFKDPDGNTLSLSEFA